jgi:hypothetical protein
MVFEQFQSHHPSFATRASLGLMEFFSKNLPDPSKKALKGMFEYAQNIQSMQGFLEWQSGAGMLVASLKSL